MRFALYLLAGSLALPPLCGAAWAQSTDCGVVGISADEAPPPLPDYDQPPVPGPGYIWTPGYWAWNNVDYYWVPGTWVEPPQPEVFWTPPYWAFIDGAYVFHRGYWGPHVGFYGGVNYGYGYSGEGFEGGRWDHGAFFYNRAATNLDGIRITNVYDKTVTINNNSRVSYNGGRDGLTARPSAAQEAIAREPHIPPTHVQTAHLRTASLNGGGFATANHGHPGVAATRRPGDFKGPGVTAAQSHPGHENQMPQPAATGRQNEPEHLATPHHEGTGGAAGEPGVHREGLGGRAGEPPAHHERRGGPAADTGETNGGVFPAGNHRPHGHNPEAVQPQTHMPAAHQEHQMEPNMPPREMQHREPPRGNGMHQMIAPGGEPPHGGAASRGAPMHMPQMGAGHPEPRGGGGHGPHDERQH